MSDVETTLAITTLVRNLTDDQIGLLLDVVGSEQRNRKALAKELRDDEDNYEAQADAKNESNEI